MWRSAGNLISQRSKHVFMPGVFVDSFRRKCQGMTDFGYFTEHYDVSGIDDLKELTAEDEAYQVEVFETGKGVHIRLSSRNEREVAELEHRIEMRGHGLDRSLYMTEEDPLLPSEYDDEHRALEMYAEYALDFEGGGIEAKVDWDSLMDEDNLHRM
jgi:hypothetical protein